MCGGVLGGVLRAGCQSRRCCSWRLLVLKAAGARRRQRQAVPAHRMQPQRGAVQRGGGAPARSGPSGLQASAAYDRARLHCGAARNVGETRRAARRPRSLFPSFPASPVASPSPAVGTRDFVVGTRAPACSLEAGTRRTSRSNPRVMTRHVYSRATRVLLKSNFELSLTRISN
jgi:hypothetical protein